MTREIYDRAEKAEKHAKAAEVERWQAEAEKWAAGARRADSDAVKACQERDFLRGGLRAAEVWVTALIEEVKALKAQVAELKKGDPTRGEVPAGSRVGAAATEPEGSRLPSIGVPQFR